MNIGLTFHGLKLILNITSKTKKLIAVNLIIIFRNIQCFDIWASEKGNLVMLFYKFFDKVKKYWSICLWTYIVHCSFYPFLRKVMQKIIFDQHLECNILK